MSVRFTYFVMLAEMRTGSNFLEDNINQHDDLFCHGELFNPHFIGQAKKDERWGMTMSARDADPFALLAAMRESDAGKLHGFRLFSDHDPRIRAHVLGDPACAKVVLTRNPLDAYISLKIAGETGQWRLTNVRHQRSATIRFAADEFAAHLADQQAGQLEIQHALQVTGQTAFHIHYDDLHDIDVLNGLARFLGGKGVLKAPSQKLKKQNPGSAEDKVSNHAEMVAALAELDLLGLNRTPGFEPRLGPAVPSYMAARGILVMPVPGSAEPEIAAWLDGIGGGVADPFNQKTLRQWKRAQPVHLSLAILRHPVARAWGAYLRVIGKAEDDRRGDVLGALRRGFDLAEGPAGVAPGRAGFTAFLAFLRANLGGQTAFRTEPDWATQTAAIQGFTQVAPPAHILREDEVASILPALFAAAGHDHGPALAIAAPEGLEQAYDKGIEAAARDVYGRDYLNFGFGDWR